MGNVFWQKMSAVTICLSSLTLLICLFAACHYYNIYLSSTVYFCVVCFKTLLSKLRVPADEDTQLGMWLQHTAFTHTQGLTDIQVSFPQTVSVSSFLSLIGIWARHNSAAESRCLFWCSFFPQTCLILVAQDRTLRLMHKGNIWRNAVPPLHSCSVLFTWVILFW